ncbi:hypothetical protein Ahy_B06g081333 [Arachis hypogaea]|uniref:Uncharacterized protein n=1 Tax=Arachis hypogaea TaxID=3818 RepID=A0A444YKR2_ARAHY|nr:hypothetical protein Ahy_B06g081333 [Arachis hypogaea]
MVTSTADVLTLMKLSEVNRAVSFAALNNRSSPSHRYPCSTFGVFSKK